MNLSHFCIRNLVPFITGDEYPPYRKGPELVKLFNSFGSRDIYDELGLPDIKKTNGNRPSRKQYVEARLLELSGKQELRQLLEYIVNLADDKHSIAEKMSELINPESYGIIDNNGAYIIQGGIIDKRQPVVNEAHFQYIQNRILNALETARVSIRLVMAWFTNQTLVDKLIEKHQKGIDVQIAIYDDGVNKKHGVDISSLPNKKIKRGQRGGLMHDKFCVIDNQIVITGSYNWTNNAEFRNDENVTIEKDPDQATRFSEEYRRLTT